MIEISLQEIETQLGLAAPLVAARPQSAHIGEDGRVMLVCFLKQDGDQVDGGHLAICFDGTDITMAHIPATLAPGRGFGTYTADWNNGLVFHSHCEAKSTGETKACFLPREGMVWGAPQALSNTPALQTRITGANYTKYVTPHAGGFSYGDLIVWPVSARTGSPESSVSSVIFARPDPTAGQLTWDYWPREPQAPKGLARLFGLKPKPSGPTDFVQPSRDAFPAHRHHDQAPVVSSAAYDGTRLLFTSHGANSSRKYGDNCAVIAELHADGSVSHLYMENFIAPNRPDASKNHNYQARFVDRGRHVLLKSRYQSTDPWKGRFALFDVATGRLTAYSKPKCETYLGPMEIIGDQAFYARSKDTNFDTGDGLAIEFRQMVPA